MFTGFCVVVGSHAVNVFILYEKFFFQELKLPGICKNWHIYSWIIKSFVHAPENNFYN